MTPSLSVVILTRLADKSIAKHLDLLQLSDSLIIISDQKPQLPKLPKKVTIYHHPLKNNFSAQRNYALTKVTTDWVLFVDDDEFLLTDLIKEIRNGIMEAEISGYYLKRTDSFYNKKLRYGESGRVKLLRLARAKSGMWKRSVHEIWDIKGKTKILSSALNHKRTDLVKGFIDRIALYSSIDSLSLNKEGKPFSFFRLFVYPMGKFLRNYFLYLGFFDGLLGLFHAYLMAIQSVTVRVYQWEKS